MAPAGKKYRSGGRVATNAAQAHLKGRVDYRNYDSNASMAEASDTDTVTTASTSAETPKQAPAGTPPVTPTGESNDETQRMVYGVGAALSQMAAMASTRGQQPERLTCFHSKFLPSVSVSAYFNRIRGCMHCSPECYVLALIYIDRLLKRWNQIVFSPLSSHRLIITTMTLAAKFHDDTFYSNSFYAKVGGISSKELGALERRLLQLLDFRLMVTPEEYSMYAAMVRKAARGVPVQD